MILKQTLDAINTLRNCNQNGRKVYIRGTGAGGRLILNELINLGIDVTAFVDITLPECAERQLLGLDILLMDDVYKQEAGSYFIVCSQMDVHIYMDIRDELEAHGLIERDDFYHFGGLGTSFLRQPEKAILNAPFLITDTSPEGMKKRQYEVLMSYYHGRVSPGVSTPMRFDYLDESIIFSRINLIPNFSCTLRCKYCCAGCQHSSGKSFDPKQSVSDFDKMLGVSKVLCAGILGGELFLHKQIAEFFRLFAEMKNILNCESVQVFTNGMVLPSDEALNAFNKIPLPKFFMISNYSGTVDMQKKFIDKLQRFNIQYLVFPPSDTHLWNHPGDLKIRNFEKIDYTESELKVIRQKCCDFYGGTTIIEGKLYICGFNVYALYTKLKDFVDIRNCPVSDLEERLYDFLYKRETYDLCAYCRGTFNFNEKIRIAEQMPKE